MTIVGQNAPDFNSMAYVNGQFKKIGLKDYKRKWVALFFYPLDFTFVCPTEIKGFARMEEEFKKLNCYIVGASTDSEHSHKAWVERDMPEVKFPILADTNHHVSRAYGVLKEDQGIAYRGLFLIDPEGIIRYEVVSDLGVGRSVKETIRVLQAFQQGGLCEVDWQPGMKTLNKKK
ncbi:MAG: peroxiredoxin [Candidatus Diapherotrites archaeon]